MREQWVTSSFTTSHAYIYYVVRGSSEGCCSCRCYNYHALLVESPTHMWPYGNHFQVDPKTIRPTHLTKDVRVACIFHQASQSSMRDQNTIIANLNYVGLLKEILLVDYFGLCLVLFKCSWIPFNLCGNARTIVKMNMGFGKWSFNVDSQ